MWGYISTAFLMKATSTSHIESFEAKAITMEQELLQKFRCDVDQLLTPSHTDAMLRKWLRAAKYDLKKAEKLFKEFLAMKDVHEVEKYADFYKVPEVLKKFEFVAELGYAKDGSPLTYVNLGRGDFYGCIASVNGYDLYRYATYRLELDLRRAREQSKKTGKEINEITYIIDMDEFSIRTSARQCVIEMAFDMLQMLQDYYPEIWKNSLIVNASPLFHTVFNFFKPILRGNLVANIYVASKETTPELLLKYVEADVLPVFLGGKRVDSNGDPMCREFLSFGGVVPEKLYAMHRPLLDPSDPDIQSVQIRTRSCYNYPMVVREANSRLHIQMRSEGGSIKATILYREFGPDPNRPDLPPSNVFLNENDARCNVRLVSPCVRLQLHLAQAEDIYCRAPWPGIYIFRADNTDNWFTSRRLIFRMQVVASNS